MRGREAAPRPTRAPSLDERSTTPFDPIEASRDEKDTRSRSDRDFSRGKGHSLAIRSGLLARERALARDPIGTSREGKGTRSRSHRRLLAEGSTLPCDALADSRREVAFSARSHPRFLPRRDLRPAIRPRCLARKSSSHLDRTRSACDALHGGCTATDGSSRGRVSTVEDARIAHDLSRGPSGGACRSPDPSPANAGWRRSSLALEAPPHEGILPGASP